MDAITAPLPIFSEPASALLPVEESDKAGASLFGALVSEFAQADRDAARGQPAADAPLEQNNAPDHVPPPVLARQWIAQLANIPDLPPGLAAKIEQYRSDANSADDPSEPAPFEPQPAPDAQPAFVPLASAAHPTTEATPQSSPVEAQDVEGDEPIDRNVKTATSLVPNNQIELPASVPVVLSSAPAVTPDSEQQAPLVDSEVKQNEPKPQDNSTLTPAQHDPRIAVRVHDSLDAEQKTTAGDDEYGASAVAQFLAPLLNEIAASEPTETSSDNAISLDAASPQRQRGDAGAISPTSADNPAPTKDAAHDLAAAANSHPAPKPSFELAVASPVAVNFLLEKQDLASFDLPQLRVPAQPAKAQPRATADAASPPDSPTAFAFPQTDDTPTRVSPIASDFTDGTSQPEPRPRTSAQPQTGNQQSAHRTQTVDLAPLSTGSQPSNILSPAPPPMPTAAPDASQALSIAPPTAAADSTNAAPAQSDRASAPVAALALRDGDELKLDALALRIAARSADGDSRFTIRLDPPELGHIEVNLNVSSQGHAQAAVVVDKPNTLDLLQRDAPTLERALKDAGLNLSGDLSFSLKSDGAPQFWRDEQNAPRMRDLEVVEAASANAAINGAARLAAPYYGAGTSRLDITV